ncbi:MAG TPA: glucose sorbosone dehydrogenase, partial [Gammaproteobacteria bacterium]|nr:glucose sorbosone dehydrogenase [Gammaproteobacteria bacterium]
MRALQSSLIWLLCLSSFCAGSSLAQDYQVKTLATGLDEPWSIAHIGDGTYLVTEKSGRLVRLEPNRSITTIKGTPPVYFASQGGLLEVLADTDFANNGMIYLSFAGG